MSYIFTQCPKFLHNVLHYDASLAHCFALQFDIIMMVYLNILLVLHFKNLLKVAKYFATLWHIWQTDIAFCKNCVLFHVTSAWLELNIALHPSVWQRGRFVQQWQCGIAALIWTSLAQDYSGIILWYLYSLISSKSMGYRWNNIMAQGEDRSRIMVGRAITGAASALNQCNVRDTVLGNTKIWLSESEKCTFYKQRNTRDNIWKIHHRASTGDGITGAARGLLLSYRGKWSIGSAPL